MEFSLPPLGDERRTPVRPPRGPNAGRRGPRVKQKVLRQFVGSGAVEAVERVIDSDRDTHGRGDSGDVREHAAPQQRAGQRSSTGRAERRGSSIVLPRMVRGNVASRRLSWAKYDRVFENSDNPETQKVSKAFAEGQGQQRPGEANKAEAKAESGSARAEECPSKADTAAANSCFWLKKESASAAQGAQNNKPAEAHVRARGVSDPVNGLCGGRLVVGRVARAKAAAAAKAEPKAAGRPSSADDAESADAAAVAGAESLMRDSMARLMEHAARQSYSYRSPKMKSFEPHDAAMTVPLQPCSPKECAQSPRGRRAKVLEDVDQALPKVELLRTIGEGAYGTVLEGRMRDQARKLAVKVEPTRAERVASELHVLRKSRGHANVVKFIFGYHHPNGKTYIGMELCTGGDLFDLMSTRHLYIKDAMYYFMEIAKGLEFLHSHNIVHHDIKPENIGLDANGHAKIIDFGLAVQLSPEQHLNPQTDKLETTVSSGTLVYCAPEIFQRRPHGVETDWWSLGVVFHEMAFHTLPWQLNDVVDNSTETTRRILKWPLQKPTVLPFADWTPMGLLAFHFIQDMLHKKPDSRISGLKAVKAHDLFPAKAWDATDKDRKSRV